jgi:hypothetical protein
LPTYAFQTSSFPLSVHGPMCFGPRALVASILDA